MIGLVACSKMKATVSCPAREMYRGDVFNKSVALLERSGIREWFILSAKYGLVHPMQRLAPYNDALADKSLREREEWGARVFDKIVAIVEPDERILFLGAEVYTSFWLTQATRAGRRVEAPVVGLTICRTKAWLRKDRVS